LRSLCSGLFRSPVIYVVISLCRIFMLLLYLVRYVGIPVFCMFVFRSFAMSLFLYLVMHFVICMVFISLFRSFGISLFRSFVISFCVCLVS